MSKDCAEIHKLFHSMPRHRFPFIENEMPANGIYVLFEDGEYGHGEDRIVRVGTHTGNKQLCSRLMQHFVAKNKDRSIFRKNIGRALLHKRGDPFLKYWNLDLTTRKAKEQYSSLIDKRYQERTEDAVSQYINAHFSFVVFEENDKETRLFIESKLISTVSLCNECKPSNDWLGKHSPKTKIVESGLWLVNELYKTPFKLSEFKQLCASIAGNPD